MSTNTALLRSASELAPAGVEPTLYRGMDQLPHFNPDDDGEVLHPAVERLRTGLRAADAVVFSTPEYAGALPGSFKNLLDWLIGDDQPGSIDTKPVGWFNSSPRGAALAHDSLRTVLTYAGAVIVDDACVHMPLNAASLDDDGGIADPRVRAQVSEAMHALAAHVRGADAQVT
jgi:NAD(P)H-dependent FMN reductase